MTWGLIEAHPKPTAQRSSKSSLAHHLSSEGIRGDQIHFTEREKMSPTQGKACPAVTSRRQRWDLNPGSLASRQDASITGITPLRRRKGESGCALLASSPLSLIPPTYGTSQLQE